MALCFTSSGNWRSSLLILSVRMGWQRPDPLSLLSFSFILSLGSLFMLVALLYVYFRTPAPHSFEIIYLYAAHLNFYRTELDLPCIFPCLCHQDPYLPVSYLATGYLYRSTCRRNDAACRDHAEDGNLWTFKVSFTYLSVSIKGMGLDCPCPLNYRDHLCLDNRNQTNRYEKAHCLCLYCACWPDLGRDFCIDTERTRRCRDPDGLSRDQHNRIIYHHQPGRKEDENQGNLTGSEVWQPRLPGLQQSL